MNRIELGDVIKYRNGNYNEVTNRIMDMLKKEYTKDLRNNYISNLDVVAIYKVKEKIEV